MTNENWKPQNIMLEHWKIIEGFENYKVSDLEFIRNRNSRKIKKQCAHENGYFYVQLWKNGKKYNKSVYRLAVYTFS